MGWISSATASARARILLDQFLGLDEDLRLGEQLTHSFDAVGRRWRPRRGLRCNRASSSSRFGRRRAFQGQRQQQRRPAGQHVLTGDQFVIAVAVPILEIVENLERDAEVLAEVGDGFLVGIGRPGQAQAGVQRRLESRGRLEGVNLQGIQRGQRLVAGIAPEQLGPLAFGQFQVRIRQAVEDVGGAIAAEFLAFAADQAIAQAEQVIADVDGRADAVLAMQRCPAIAEGVVVLDVVVNQRSLVKRLDGQRRAPDAVGQVRSPRRRACRALP